uniref:DUF1758 domain-containing protein n=1 Tax=Haemonchus contortus TaxID=6289 RepID=A0A7I4YQP3_HAECO
MSLPGATKFSLLKSCLRGRALQCIEGLPITDRDCTTAVDILHMTYDKPCAIRHLIYTELSNLPQCDIEGKQLQDIYLKMLRLVRQYTAITPESPEYGHGALLYNKLPKFVKARIYDKTGGQRNLTPNELMELLSEIVMKESTLRQVEFSTNPSHSYYHVWKKQGHSTPRRNTATPPPVKMSQRHSTLCPFCKRSNHNAYQCRTFSTAEERRTAMRQNRLCFQCLRPDHRTTACTRSACYLCKYHHHPALCFKAKSVQKISQLKKVNEPSLKQNVVSSSKFQEDQNKQWRWQDNNARSTRQPPQPTPANKTRTINFSMDANIENHQEDENSISRKNSEAGSSHAVVSHFTTTNNENNDDHQIPREHTLLMCAEVTLTNPDDVTKQLITTAFLDSGSSHSYITSDVAEQLQLRSVGNEITLYTFGSTEPMTVSSKLYQVNLLLPDSTLYKLDVQSLPHLTKPLMAPYDLQTALRKLSRDAPLSTVPVQTGILIGMDHFWQLVLSAQFYSTKLSNGYCLLNTRLGKIIAGKKISTRTINMAVQDDHDHPLNKESLDEMVQRFWTCESLGTLDEASSRDDLLCLDFFNRTTRYDEKEHRYYVRLPFKSEPPPVPENYSHRLACLCSNWKTLSKNPDHLDKYDNIIHDQLQRGIISETPPSMIEASGTYLSHHAVINLSKKTTKIRLVYNGSAKIKGSPSLDDCLFRGTVLLPDLSGILLRVRLANFLLIKDIEKHTIWWNWKNAIDASQNSYS